MILNSKEIVDYVMTNHPNIQDWRAYNEICQVWKMLREMNGLKGVYCNREDEGIEIAYALIRVDYNVRIGTVLYNMC